MTNKKSKKNATIKQAKAIKLLIEKQGMSVQAAMRAAGYAEGSIKNPSNLTRTKAYRDILNDAGVTDSFLAKRHREASNAVDIKERQFIDRIEHNLVKIDPESEKFDKSGPPMQYREEMVHIPVSDKEIKAFFKRLPDFKLMRIEQGYRQKTAVYLAPQYQVRTKMQELSYKVKEHFGAEKHEIVLPEATEDEKEIIKNLLNI